MEGLVNIVGGREGEGRRALISSPPSLLVALPGSAVACCGWETWPPHHIAPSECPGDSLLGPIRSGERVAQRVLSLVGCGQCRVLWTWPGFTTEAPEDGV